MKRYLIIGALLLSAITHAHADLGNSYATFVNAWHNKGHVNGDTIQWLNPDATRTDCTAVFKNNQAVCVYYSFRSNSGLYIPESELWRLLIGNSVKGQTWQEYAREDDSREYVSNDGLVYAKVWKNGQILRVAYKSYLERHNLLTVDGKSNNNDPTLPPVEEDNQPSPSPTPDGGHKLGQFKS